MMEIDTESRRGYVYGREALKLLESARALEFAVERSEELSGMTIYTVSIGACDTPTFSLDLSRISDIKCIHGKKLEFSSVNRLPQEGWQELVDCWSCHNHEFKSLLDLKIAPRKGGILVSNFYLLAHDDALPPCCLGRTKLFYNELNVCYPHSHFVYKFFEEYFATKNSIVFDRKEKALEIKLFYKCLLFEDTVKEAFKVGIKETDKQLDCDSFIGEFFKKMIFDEIDQNSLGIKAMGYNLSFITYE